MNEKVILRGASAIMPLCIGDFPFSFIVGALSVSAGMSVWQSTAWSAIVIAGSAQMLALNMLKTGATLGVIIFTTLIINLRHVLVSGPALLAGYRRRLRARRPRRPVRRPGGRAQAEGNNRIRYAVSGGAGK